MADPIVLTHAAGRVAVDPDCGHLMDLALHVRGGLVHPLWRAPWADRPETVDPDLPPLLSNLSGDFLCAPFSVSDVEGGPPHGPTANTPWRETGRAGDTAEARLDLVCTGTILGARIEKTLRFRDADPVLYQAHRLVGGAGAVPVAHHVMIHPRAGCRLSTSPKRYVATSDVAIEPDPARGRSILAYPQRADGLDSLALAGDERVDARSYPFAERHEDLVMMVERDLSGLGWTAAAHAAEGFLFFTVKSARELPATVLWISNRGRDYHPFDQSPGRVLGIEDACSFLHEGHRASAAPNWMTEDGVPTAIALDPGGARTVRLALGVIPIDETWSGDVTLEIGGGRITARDSAGPEAAIPFDDGWLADA